MRLYQLYVGNGRCPRPDKSNCTWKKSGHGDDVVTIYYFDARFAPGFLYVGVHGATQADFSLKAVWKDVDIVQAGSMPSPGPSRLSNATPGAADKRDAVREESGIAVLPKILNPTKGLAFKFFVCFVPFFLCAVDSFAAQDASL